MRFSPREEQGEVLIGFILVAFLILALVWAIIDISRYAMMKSSTLSSANDVVRAAKSEDALLLNHYDRSDVATMDLIANARRRLSSTYQRSPVYTHNAQQLTAVPVAGYGTQSGPEVKADDLQYVAVVPPGTSAKFRFPNGTESWIHHAVCCDPTVDNCPEEKRRGKPTNPCGTQTYDKLISQYPTEFVTAAVPNNTQIFSSPIITRTSGFPRVAITSVPVIVVTSTTVPPEIICVPTDIITKTCSYDTVQKKITVNIETKNSCTGISVVSVDTIDAPSTSNTCDPARGAISYEFDQESCSFKENITPITRNPSTCEIVGGGTSLLKTVATVNPATCSVADVSETVNRETVQCVEQEGYSWRKDYEANLLSCSWDPKLVQIQKTPVTRCLDNGTVYSWELLPAPSCRYHTTFEVHPNLNPPCTERAERMHYEFNVDICDWTFVSKEPITKPPDEDIACHTTDNRVHKIATTYEFVMRDGTGAYLCQWSKRENDTIVESRDLLCTVDPVSGIASKTTYALDTVSCEYRPNATVTVAKEEFTCAHDVVTKTATKTQRVLDPVQCAYVNGAVTVTSDEFGCVPVNAEQDIYALSTTHFDAASCSYVADAATNSITKPAVSCSVEGEKTDYTINRTTCAWVPTRTTISRPADSCAGDGVKTVYSWDAASCSWIGAQNTIEKPVAACAEGVSTAFTWNTATCAWDRVDTTVARPSDSCSTEGVHTAYSWDAAACSWKATNTTVEKPVTACTEGTATTYRWSARGCGWGRTDTPVAKPADSCTAEGIKTAYIWNSTSCSWNSNEETVAKPGDSCNEGSITHQVWDSTQCVWRGEVTTVAKPSDSCRSDKFLTYLWNASRCQWDESLTDKPCAEEVCSRRIGTPYTEQGSPYLYPDCTVEVVGKTNGVCPAGHSFYVDFSYDAGWALEDRQLDQRYTGDRFDLGWTPDGGKCFVANCTTETRTSTGLVSGYTVGSGATQQKVVCSDAADVCSNTPRSSWTAVDEHIRDEDRNHGYTYRYWVTKYYAFANGIRYACDTEPHVWIVDPSPISLLWNNKKSLDIPPVLTDFPISENNIKGDNHKWYQWYGSEETPLIIYDPQHRATPRTAADLFGTHTFGKKWANGYEALRTVDSNKDNIISGKELEPLALWFDKNRDGKAQNGEVKTFAEAGVTKLFTKTDSLLAPNGDIYARIGFERVEEGKIIQGTSVDWFAKEYSTKEAGIEDIANITKKAANPTNEDLETAARIDRIMAHVKKVGIPAEKKSKSLTGAWRWNTSERYRGRQGAGVLVFNALGKDKKLTGWSYIETVDKETGSTNITRLPVEGTMVQKNTYKFRVSIPGLEPEITPKTETGLLLEGDTIKALSVTMGSRPRVYSKDSIPEVYSYNFTGKREK